MAMKLLSNMAHSAKPNVYLIVLSSIPNIYSSIIHNLVDKQIKNRTLGYVRDITCQQNAFLCIAIIFPLWQTIGSTIGSTVV